MHRQQFTALAVNHRLPFALHLAHLLLHRRRFELLLNHIGQEDRLAAIGTEHFPLATRSQRLGDLRLVAKSLRESIALLIPAEIAPQPRHVLRVLHEMIMHVTQ
jgi:hypothetical protein